MSAAYFKLLRETTEPDFREALLRSQRRWLSLRAQGNYPSDGDESGDEGAVVLALTRERLRELQSGFMRKSLNQQRDFREKISGGDFDGVRAECFFVSPGWANGVWAYECWGGLNRQNGERVCSLYMEWASGHVTDYRLVSSARNGKVEPVASCATGYASAAADEPCPDRVSAPPNAHWNLNPRATEDAFPKAGGLWKYDADFATYGNDDWMRDCLHSPQYPPGAGAQDQQHFPPTRP